MQQQQPGALTRSRISSLLISRHLTRPRFASKYSFRTSSYFKLLYQSVYSDNNYVCHECVNLPEVGMVTQNLSGEFRAPVAEPPF